MWEIIVFIALVILFVRLLRVESRLKELEGKTGSHTQTQPKSAASTPTTAPAPPMAASNSTGAPTPSPSAPQPVVPPPQVPTASPVPPPLQTAPLRTAPSVPAVNQPSPEPAQPSAFWSWWKEHTLIKIGALIFLFGTIWFVSYAIDQGWLSPLARIVLGILLGLGILVIGHWRQSVREQFLTLTALGGVIIIGSVYAGQQLFAIFHPLFALILLVGTVAYVVLVSVRHEVEWLCASAAFMSLLAPVIATTDPEPDFLFFFGYLFALASSFLVIVWLTNWRSILLIFVVMVAGYQTVFFSDGAIADTFLWLTVILFSLLFLGAISVSLFRSNQPESLDLTALGLQTVVFVSFAHTLALSASLSTFVASFITGAIGYLMYHHSRDLRVCRIYFGLSLAFLFLGTSFLLDGYSLALAYTAEATLVIGLAVLAQFSLRAVRIAVFTILLPVFASIPLVFENTWRDSALHPGAFALYVLTGALFVISAMLCYRIVRDSDGRKELADTARTFVVLGWLYAVVVVGLVWYAQTLSNDAANVGMYMTWLVLAVLVCLWLRATGLFTSFLAGVIVGLPLLVSYRSIGSDRWEYSWWHVDAFGFLFTTLTVALYAIIGLWKQVRLKQPVTALEFSWGVLWFNSVVYAGLTIYALPLPEETANAVTTVLWGLISYLFVVTFFRSGQSPRWIVTALVSFGLPIFTSLAALVSWPDGILGVEAVSLYVLNVLFILIVLQFGLRLRDYQHDQSKLQNVSLIMLVIVALYSLRIVWLAMHDIFRDNDSAVVAALFVYTIAGLITYSFGRARGTRELRLTGIGLLVLVVTRLVLIDVWQMEVLWRVVTFMGIGALFIATALIERPLAHDQSDEQQPPVPPSSPMT